MTYRYARRIQKVKKSFIRKILKAGDDPNIISFAGGLPNARFFPVEAIAAAAAKVLAEDGANVLQYTVTEGYRPLREWIAQRYRQKYNFQIEADEILITTGSQQGLDLLGKLFLDSGDPVIIERPGYLGAIQVFSMFEADLQPVPLQEDGIDLDALEAACATHQPKLFYAVPNFQNPSGLSYSPAKRGQVAEIINKHNVIFIEDNPYGELRFEGADATPLWGAHPDQTVLLGSFSKIVSPSLRLGWLCAKAPLMEKLVTAKQAADLHSSYLSQRVLYQYLLDNDLEAHIATIRTAYKGQRDLMMELIDEQFPPEVQYTQPEGGMFLWLALPKGMSSLALFETAIQQQVAFVPGHPFYVDGGGADTLRLNFSNADEAKIQAGMERLGNAMKEMWVNNQSPVVSTI